MRKLNPNRPDGGEGELVPFEANDGTAARAWQAAAASTGFVVRTTAEDSLKLRAGHVASAKVRVRLGPVNAATPGGATVGNYASALERDGSPPPVMVWWVVGDG